MQTGIAKDYFKEERDILYNYFPGLSQEQRRKFDALGELYKTWNVRINLISRKDIDHLYLHHVLHSLVVAKIVSFQKDAQVLDVGTGGGFPGIPLAILFPQTHFCLLDSIAKKVKVVTEISQALQLDNVTPICQRAEKAAGQHDFVVTRAVASLGTLHGWLHDKIKSQHAHTIPNGLLCWKGGDLDRELAKVPMQHTRYDIQQFCPQPVFADKCIVHLY